MIRLVHEGFIISVSGREGGYKLACEVASENNSDADFTMTFNEFTHQQECLLGYWVL